MQITRHNGLARCVVLAASLYAAAVGARGLHVKLDSVEAEGIIAQGLDVHLFDRPDGSRRMTALVESVRLPVLADGAWQLRAECDVSRTDGAWRCNGSGQLQTVAGKPVAAEFVASVREGRVALELSRDLARLRLDQTAEGQASKWRLQLHKLPLAWLTDAVHSHWPDLSRVAGQLDLEIAFAGDAPHATTSLDYHLRDLAFDTNSGRVAADKVDLRGKVKLDSPPPRWSLAHSGHLGGGELLIADFYTKFGAAPVRLDFALAQASDGAIDLRHLHIVDPSVLDITASAKLIPADAVPLRSLTIEQASMILPAAYERYAKSLLAPRGLGTLTTRGQLSAAAHMDEGTLSAWSFQADELGIADDAGRFRLTGVSGGLRWQHAGDAQPSSLRWSSVELYRIAFGAAQMQWQSREGALGLATAVRIPVFAGALELLSLSVRPDVAREERWRASLALHDIDLTALSHALGWPEFGGKLGGAIPQLRYVGERLELAGGLMLNVFDGTLNVTGLALERPFGVAPALTAEIDFSQLDLSLLTGTFDIGEISGRLSGAVRGLRLSDWSPVAFDAELNALDGGRISQRAVNSISAVGGGGIAAGLQASMLRLFDTFGYSRLGIGCRLEKSICHMRGLDAGPGGYTLVDGRGLPRIRIVGHQAQVDWAVLLDRLKAAMTGTSPIIQ